MSLTVLSMVVVVVVLVLVAIAPRVKGMSSALRTMSERRRGNDRRQRRIRVPFERRKKHRRTDDAAEDFVSRLEGNR